MEIANNIPNNNSRRKFSRTCSCGKNYNVKSSFYKHKKTCAPLEQKQFEDIFRKPKFLCKEEGCNFRSKLAKELLQHLESAHNIESSKDLKTFYSYSEFLTWKYEYEKTTTASFLLRKTQKTVDGRKEYFYCNRSGSYQSQSNRKRRLKLHGLRKIGLNCPANIKVCVNEKAEKIVANIDCFHYGHDRELAHLSIPKKDKTEIAQQLLQGVPKTLVLKNIYSNEEVQVERKHLCTKRDLLNISNSYGIEKSEKNNDDQLDIEAFVEDSLQGNKEILLYKKQGDLIYYPKNDTCFENSDFALGVMTNFQKKMYQQFGHNTIFIDVTYRTHFYDFDLISVLIIDDNNESIPIAWLFSNRISAQILLLFFKQIKMRVNDISPQYFMSDDKLKLYFNCWEEIFKGKTKNLLVDESIQQNWKKQLSKIREKETEIIVHRNLCCLLKEKDKDKFEVLVEKCYKYSGMNSDIYDLIRYLKSEWNNNKKEWDKCSSDNNRFINFHESLKYIENYLSDKREKRIGKCLSLLLQFSQKYARTRLIKLENGKNTWKDTEVNKRHQIATNLTVNLVKKQPDFTWKVKDSNLRYTVKKCLPCKNNCNVKCNACDICLHSFTCNCPDSLIGSNICKHVHLVVKSQNETVSESSESEDSYTEKITIYQVDDTDNSNEDLFEEN